jgi:hypothetical protein
MAIILKNKIILKSQVMNEEKTKKKWYKTIGFLASLIVAVIAGIFIPLILHESSSDFQVTLIPNVGEVVKGGSVNTKVVVEAKKYDSNIKLTTKSQDEKIDIIIEPSNGIASPKFESDVTIKVANNIKAGEYELEIIGIGAKNKVEHSSKYFLKVKDPPFTPQDMVNFFYPDGWMGDINDINLNCNCIVKPYSGNSCIQIQYTPRGTQTWAGIYWVYPNNNWGDKPEGRNLTGAKTLNIKARGNKGGEMAEFKIGGISEKYSDSVNPARSTGPITLTSDWREYTIDLNGCDLSNIIGGFCWVTNAIQNPNGSTIYLDDIIFK